MSKPQPPLLSMQPLEAPLTPSVQSPMQELILTELVAWSGHKLAPMAPVAQTRGKRMVAELLLEDRE